MNQSLKHYNTLFAVAIGIFWSACSSEPEFSGTGEISLSAEQQEIVDGYTDFAFEYFAAAAQSNSSTDNLIISPLSAANLLSMLNNGADQATRQTIATILHTSGSCADINNLNKYLNQSLKSLTPKVKFDNYRSFWNNLKYETFTDFTNTLKSVYAAECFTFNNPQQFESEFDKWLRAKSHNQLGNLKLNVTDQTAFILSDLIYFKGEWKNKFDAGDSHIGTFHNFDSTTSDVMMMEQTLLAQWYSDRNYDALWLDFANGEYSMIYVLPGNDDDINSIIPKLGKQLFSDFNDGEKIYENKTGYSKVPVVIPRLDIKNQLDITEPLKRLGLGNSWTGIVKDQSVGLSFIQGNSINVDEQGATASSVTVTSGDTAILFETGEPFIVDRPFVYIILENSTGTIIQMGKISQL